MYTVHLKPSVLAAQAAAMPAFPPDAAIRWTAGPWISLDLCANKDIPRYLKDCEGCRFYSFLFVNNCNRSQEKWVTSSFKYTLHPSLADKKVEKMSGVSSHKFWVLCIAVLSWDLRRRRQDHASRTDATALPPSTSSLSIAQRCQIGAA